MAVTIDNLPVEDVAPIYQYCLEQGLPVDHFAYRANKFMTSCGPHPGRGWLLVRRETLDKLDLNSRSHFLDWNTYGTDQSCQPLHIPNLMIVPSPVSVTPGVPGDQNEVFVIQVADVRWLAANEYYTKLAQVHYNVIVPAAPQVYLDSSSKPPAASGGIRNEEYTWQEVLDDLWNTQIGLSALGLSPQLPYDPTIMFGGLSIRGPRELDLKGRPAWRAYNELLTKLNVFLAPRLGKIEDEADGVAANRYNFSLETMTSERYQDVASQNASFEALLGFLDKARSENAVLFASDTGTPGFDAIHYEPVAAKVPAKVRVFFHSGSALYLYGTERGTTPDNNWRDQQVYSLEVSNPYGDTNLTDSETEHGLWDDAPAEVDFDGTITEAMRQVLLRRAADVANRYYDRIYAGYYTYTIAGTRFLSTWPDRTVPTLAITEYGIDSVGGDTGTKIEISRQPGVPAASQAGRWHYEPEWWQPGASNTNRVTFPTYPPPSQALVIAQQLASPGNRGKNTYAASIVRLNPITLALQATVQNCWVIAPTGVTLTAGDIVMGRVNGYGWFNAEEYRPIYLTGKAGGGSSSSCHVIDVLSAQTHCENNGLVRVVTQACGPQVTIASAS